MTLDNAFNKLAMNGKGVPLSGRTVSLIPVISGNNHDEKSRLYLKLFVLTSIGGYVLAHDCLDYR